jgi:hypothetical protein
MDSRSSKAVCLEEALRYCEPNWGRCSCAWSKDSQELVPKESKEKEENSYSGNYGTGEVSLHTDMAHW